jgi:RNase H-fold protein (predicted Holliday junction resolvase)
MIQNILCIDRWSENIGLAYTLDNYTVLPLWSLHNDNQTLYRLGYYIQIKKIERIVIGQPKDVEIDAKIKKFARELSTLLHSEQDIVYQNEDYSTIQAMADMPNATKNAQDTISAMKILGEYLKKL